MEFRVASLDDIANKDYMKLYPFNTVPLDKIQETITDMQNSEHYDIFVLEDLATYEIIGSATVIYRQISKTTHKKTTHVEEIRVKKKYQCCGIEQYILRKVLTIAKERGFSMLTFNANNGPANMDFELIFKKHNFYPINNLMCVDVDAIKEIKRSPKRPKLDINMEIGPIFPNN